MAATVLWRKTRQVTAVMM